MIYVQKSSGVAKLDNHIQKLFQVMDATKKM